ncbi:hypothetical protein [Mycobacterium colombiense]|nr:hypothetical protein [Mycobacterium colombiense]
MKIDAALAADLDILTAGLDQPGANVLHTLHQSGVDARAAVPTYLGLRVTVDDSDPPFTFTILEDGAVTDDVRSSLRLRLPGAGGGRSSLSVSVILYAATPGACVDLTADVAWLTGRPPSDFVLDQHLPGPDRPDDAGTYLRTVSVINQAIGVLIGRGYTPEQADRELDTRGERSSAERHVIAQSILDTLAAGGPANAATADDDLVSLSRSVIASWRPIPLAAGIGSSMPSWRQLWKGTGVCPGARVRARRTSSGRPALPG